MALPGGDDIRWLASPTLRPAHPVEQGCRQHLLETPPLWPYPRQTAQRQRHASHKEAPRHASLPVWPALAAQAGMGWWGPSSRDNRTRNQEPWRPGCSGGLGQARPSVHIMSWQGPVLHPTGCGAGPQWDPRSPGAHGPEQGVSGEIGFLFPCHLNAVSGCTARHTAWVLSLCAWHMTGCLQMPRTHAWSPQRLPLTPVSSPAPPPFHLTSQQETRASTHPHIRVPGLPALLLDLGGGWLGSPVYQKGCNSRTASQGMHRAQHCRGPGPPRLASGMSSGV